MSKSNVENIKNEFLLFKEKAGKPRYVACFGKTFVDENNPRNPGGGMASFDP